MAVDLTDYNDVAARIVDFREKYPEGSLQPADLAVPYRIETIGDQTFIIVVAAAYRSPGDERPGVGMAFEVFPGRTPYTRNSELQNAETSAWGRAIVAALAADTKKGVASAEEIRNRQAERESFDQAQPAEDEATTWRRRLATLIQEKGRDPVWGAAQYHQWSQGGDIRAAKPEELRDFHRWLREQPDIWEAGESA